MSQPHSDPVFVLGVHRSGTTWLTAALAQQAHCAPITVRHLLQAVDGEPLARDQARDRLETAAITVRPGDARPVTPDMSEEYGYLLALAHGSSRTTARSLPSLRALVADVAAESPGAAPLLRNPWDYAASHRLRTWFPSARFVFVHRDPIDTVGSAVEMFQDFWRSPHPYALRTSPRYARAWKSPWRRAALQWVAARPALAARIVARGTAFAHRAHLIDSRGLSPGRVVHVRYADMLQDLPTTVQRVCDTLGLARAGDTVPEPAAPRKLPDRPWMSSVVPRLRRATQAYRAARLVPA